jgi:hypothetical protein
MLKMGDIGFSTSIAMFVNPIVSLVKTIAIEKHHVWRKTHRLTFQKNGLTFQKYRDAFVQIDYRSKQSL